MKEAIRTEVYNAEVSVSRFRHQGGLSMSMERPEVTKYLLASLRHWCDANGIDFAEIDKQAYTLYLEQKVQAG